MYVISTVSPPKWSLGAHWLAAATSPSLTPCPFVNCRSLQIGNEEIERIPIGNRVFLGLFQAIAVRTSGLAVVSLATIAPALQVLFVSMFQVAAYPIAVSIRSTNVYEERSIGVFEESDDEDEIEARFDTSARKKTPKTTGNYIRYHARKQLAFDMWCTYRFIS